jgi:hypothetical protein
MVGTWVFLEFKVSIFENLSSLQIDLLSHLMGIVSFQYSNNSYTDLKRSIIKLTNSNVCLFN